MLQFVSLGSGSGGNSYWVSSGQSSILIDCGLSTKQIESRLASLNLSLDSVEAVFITHGHTDHVGAANRLYRRLNKSKSRSHSFGVIREHVPFYMSRGTYAFTDERCLPERVEQIAAGDCVNVGDLSVDAFDLTHDAPETLGYRIGHQGYWAGILTDFGSFTPTIHDKMRSLSIMALEFNHDPQMLMNGAYPYHLKKRVLSLEGHLSNQQAEEALRKTLSPRLQHLIISHISERNNTPALALYHANRAISDEGFSDGLHVHLAEQGIPGPLLEIDTPAEKRSMVDSYQNMKTY